MTSSADTFWKAVGHWGTDQPRIALDFYDARPPYTGIVINVREQAVTFRDLETGLEQTVNFEGADIRFHSFERIDSICAFVARWEDEDGLNSVKCLLTELRAFGKAN
jgi:hypothetical protein